MKIVTDLKIVKDDPPMTAAGKFVTIQIIRQDVQPVLRIGGSDQFHSFDLQAFGKPEVEKIILGPL